MNDWQKAREAAEAEQRIEEIEYDRLDPPRGRRMEPEHFAELSRMQGGDSPGRWRG